MITAEPVNMQSLGMVRDELVATLEKAARDLEIHVANPEQGKGIVPCIRGVQQTLGVTRMLSLRGASILADELLLALVHLQKVGVANITDKRIEIIGSTFFALITYVDYLQRSQNRIPVLLIPYINDLRKVRREPTLPESFFFTLDLKTRPKLPGIDPIVVSETEFKALIIRLRHMYQVGLLGVLRGQASKSSLGLMRRALVRLQRVGGSGKPLTLLWWLANLCLAVMEQQNMELLDTRKMLLNRIDRVIRQVQKVGLSAFNAAPPKGLLKELIYLLAISGHPNKTIKAILRFYKVGEITHTETELGEERRAIQGPSVNTVRSLARVLRGEINNVKTVLELAEQSGQNIDDLDGLIATLSKISETLSIVGLNGPSGILKQEIKRVTSWKGEDNDVDERGLSEVAKTLIYLESTVCELERNTKPSKELNADDEQSRKDIVAMSELAQAESIVLEESESGLSLSKRAIGAFSDSNFDPGHIKNIARTLNAVRGGMLILRRDRAAKVLGRCVKFVDDVLMQVDQPPALKELLETFADAIISVEYYINAIRSSQNDDDTVLELAEESMAALGFSVEKA